MSVRSNRGFCGLVSNVRRVLRGVRAPRALLVCVMGTGPWLHASAQAPTSEEVIASARRAYGAGPYAESLAIEATDGLGRTERSEIVVRVRPNGPGTDAAEILAELGRLRVWAGPGETVVTHASGAGSWWGEGADPSTTSAVQMLSRALPPIAAPSIAILRGDAGWTPVTDRIAWNGVVEDPAGAAWLLAGQVIDARTGQPGDLAVQAAFDRESARLVRLIVSGPGVSGLQRLSITVAPAPTGEIDAWRPLTDPSLKKATLAAIVGTRPRLATGDRFPHVIWVRSDGGAWRLEPVQDAAARVTAFVLIRVSREAGETAAALTDARACIGAFVERVRAAQRASIGRGGDGGLAPRLVCGAVFAIDAFDADRFAAISGELSELLVDEPGVVWTSPGAATIDAMAPDASAVLCVVDGDGTVRSIVVIDGMAGDSAAARDAVERAADQAMGVPMTGDP